MAKPLNRLPPLNAMRAFVAAVKHLSFTRAANDLFVTPAAVSQQVKLLEDTLGCALFRRTNRGVALAKAQLAAEDLKAGRLVQPFAISHAVDFAYYFVCPQSKIALRKVEAFRTWLREQAHADCSWSI